MEGGRRWQISLADNHGGIKVAPTNVEGPYESMVVLRPVELHFAVLGKLFLLKPAPTYPQVVVRFSTASES